MGVLGVIFLLSVVLVTGINGELGLLITGLVIGWIVWVMLARQYNRMPQQVLDSQLEDLRQAVMAEKDLKLRAKLRKELEVQEKEIRARVKIDHDAIRQRTMLIGLGCVIAPLIGSVMIAIRFLGMDEPREASSDPEREEILEKIYRSIWTERDLSTRAALRKEARALELLRT